MINAETLDIINDVISYWEEVDKMGYIVDRIDIKTSKPNRRFNQMQNLILNANILQ